MKYFFLLVLIATCVLQAQWIPLNSSFGKRISGLHVEGNTIIASTDSNGVYFSSNGGQTWTQRNSGITNLRVLSLAKRNNIIAAGTYGAGVFISTNNGSSWSVSTNGMTLPYIFALYITQNNNIFAGSGGYGGYISTNMGSNWTTNLLTTYVVNCYTITPAGYYLCGAGPRIYKSTNEGTSWSQLASGNAAMEDIITIPKVGGGFNILVGSSDGMFISTNEGVSWSEINSGIAYRIINSLAASGTNVFAGSHGGGVYLTTNNGTNWTAINTGLTNLFVMKLFIDGAYIYAGTENGVIWRRELSQVITSIEDEIEDLNSFSLHQNYPNPFNPSTNLSFVIGHSSFVSLKVFDVLGKEVATLVDEFRNAGAYEINFDASDLPSGIYFYRMTAGNFTETKKMILTR